MSVRAAIVEILEADAQLAALLGDGADGIYHRKAPQDAELPAVILYQMGGEPEYTFGDFHDEFEYVVKGVCRGGDSGVAEAISERAYALLQDAELNLAGETLWCRRERDIDYGEDDEGTLFHHTGIIYRIAIEP